MEAKNTTHGVVVVIAVFVVVGFLPPPSSAAAPPDSCLAYAFTQSEEHFFLLESNATLYGDDLTMIHNCDQVAVYVDGIFFMSGDSGLDSSIQPGEYGLIELRSNESTWKHYNVTIRPDRLDWDFNFSLAYPEPPGMISEEEAEVMQNWAAAGTAFIVWVLCVYVWWNLVNAYVQRNFIEEVAG